MAAGAEADKGPPAEVETFLANVPEDAREALLWLRRLIRVAAPDAVEMLNYGVPAFKYQGRPLVSYGAGKSGKERCSFYVQSPELMEAIREDLKAYDTAKGTIHFSPDNPLPETLVTKLVQARIAEVQAAEAARKSKARSRGR